MTKDSTVREEVPTLSEAAVSQLHRKALARGAWSEGRPSDALIILETVLSEQMEPAVAVECLVTQAAFRAELEDFFGALESLNRAAPLIEQASPRVRGAFFNQRARIHKELGRNDAALTDYAGASIWYESVGDNSSEGGVALNVAGLCLKMNQLSRARQYVEKAITKMVAAHSEYLSQAYDTHALILLAEGKLEAAIVEIDLAIKTETAKRNNELWLKQYQKTKDEIKRRLISLCLPLVQVRDLRQMELRMLERALRLSNGSVTKAGEIMGITHKAVSSLIKNHPEFAHLRKPARVRRKRLVSR